MLKIIPAEPSRIAEAAALAREEYQAERQQLLRAPAPPLGVAPALPPLPEEAALSEALAALFAGPYAFVALEEERMVGYMAFEGPFDGFFGRVKGAFSPLHGCAAVGPRRRRVLESLLARALGRMAADCVYSPALCRYAHDEDAREALTLCGFGIRCADAVRPLLAQPATRKAVAPAQIATDSLAAGLGALVGAAQAIAPDPPLPESVTLRRIGWRDAGPLLSLQNGLSAHLRRTPTFFPSPWFTELSFTKRRESRRHRFFVAYDKGAPVAYIEVGGSGENLLTGQPCVQNICGAFALPEYRRLGVAGALVESAVAACRAAGADYLGVDCETLNLAAQRFWGKRFTTYTYSYHRRLDERVADLPRQGSEE